MSEIPPEVRQHIANNRPLMEGQIAVYSKGIIVIETRDRSSSEGEGATIVYADNLCEEKHMAGWGFGHMLRFVRDARDRWRGRVAIRHGQDVLADFDEAVDALENPCTTEPSPLHPSRCVS